MQGLEQSGGKAAGGAEAGATRDVGHGGELKVGLGDAGELQGFAEDGVLDLVNALGALEF